MGTRANQVSAYLRDVSIKYGPQSYINSIIAPVRDNVPHKFKIDVYDSADWLRDEATVRAPGTPVPVTGYSKSSVSLQTKQYAHGAVVTQEDIDQEGEFNSPPDSNAETAVEFATDKVELKKEVTLASLIQATTLADGTSGGIDAQGGWAAGSSSTFLANVSAGRIGINKKTGVNPMDLYLACDQGTFETIKADPTVIAKYQYSQAGNITAQMIADAIQVKGVIVGSSILNTTARGLAQSTKYIWENNTGKGWALLFYSKPAVGLKTHTFAGQFRTKFNGQTGRSITQWYDEATYSWHYDVIEDTDIKIIDPNLGWAWKDTIAT